MDENTPCFRCGAELSWDHPYETHMELTNADSCETYMLCATCYIRLCCWLNERAAGKRRMRAYAARKK
jgi:hypothetical protein